MSVGPWQGLDAMASMESSLQQRSGDGAPSRVSGAKPPEDECLLYFACPKEAANLPHY